MPVARSHMGNVSKAILHWTKEVQYEPVFRLGSNMMESFSRLNQVERLCKKLPGPGLRFLRSAHLQGAGGGYRAGRRQ